MKHFAICLLAILFIGCSGESPENLSKEVDRLIAEDNYGQALALIETADPGKNDDADIPRLKEKTHLNYGLYLEYRGPEDSSMRERMTSALEHYIEVLKINEQNQTARAEIKQIMGIYQTMPDRSPGEEILKELRTLGFDF